MTNQETYLIRDRNKGGYRVYLKGFYFGDPRYTIESDAKIYTDKNEASAIAQELNEKYSSRISLKHEVVAVSSIK